MQPKTLKDLAIEEISTNKGSDIVCFDISQRTNIADFMIIANSRSSRHMKFLAEHLVHSFKDNGIDTVKVEGDANTGWILLDTRDIIIHLMTPSVREFYSLEKIWDQEHFTNLTDKEISK